MMDMLKLIALWSLEVILIPSAVSSCYNMAYKNITQRSLKITSWQEMQYQILPAIPIEFFTRYVKVVC